MSKAKRESFEIVPETFPAVKAALSNISSSIEVADDLIKEQTGKLREAFIDAIERAMEAEAKAETLTSEVDLWKNNFYLLNEDLQYQLSIIEKLQNGGNHD